MKPTFSLKKIQIHKHSGIKFNRINCPKGTVPVRRTRREDLVRARRFLEEHATNIHPLDVVPSGFSNTYQRAIVNVEYEDNTGGGGSVKVINPRVDNDQSSSALLIVEKGSLESGDFSGFQAGWTVSPALYGDNNTRLFTSWQNYIGGNPAGGCFNDLCPGFVHVDNAPPLNVVIPQVSVYDGDSYGITISIMQDKQSKNWWLVSQDIKFGYWTDEIVSHLSGGADRLAWGGMTYASSSSGINPPMGFGIFQDGNFKHVGFFGDLHYYDENGDKVELETGDTDTVVDNDNCYKVDSPGNRGDKDGFTFSYGGPGGKCSG